MHSKHNVSPLSPVFVLKLTFTCSDGKLGAWISPRSRSKQSMMWYEKGEASNLRQVVLGGRKWSIEEISALSLGEENATGPYETHRKLDKYQAQLAIQDMCRTYMSSYSGVDTAGGNGITGNNVRSGRTNI